MTQVSSPFASRKLRMARALPNNQKGRTPKELTTEQKRLARHLSWDEEKKYSVPEIGELIGWQGGINTLRRQLIACGIRTQQTRKLLKTAHE